MAPDLDATAPSGRKTWRFLDAFTAFFAALLHPILNALTSVFASSSSPSSTSTPPKSQSGPDSSSQPSHEFSPNRQSSAHQPTDSGNRDEANTQIAPSHVPATSSTSRNSLSQTDLHLVHGSTAGMQPPVHSGPVLASTFNGSEANGKATPVLKASQSGMQPPNGLSENMRDKIPAFGAATNPAERRELANTTNHSKPRFLGEEQAAEDRQEQLTLPPPTEPVSTSDQQASQNEAKEPEDPVEAAERAMHHGFMNQALDMARLSLKTNETPVGCVLVHNGRVVAKGMNATNITRNGTRHAELMAITALLSYTPKDDMEAKGSSHSNEQPASNKGDKPPLMRTYSNQEWGDVDPKDGHIYPYGQKLHPAPRVDRDLIQDCILYVTVEPCVMCASMLRQFGIKKVYFGAVNDKFGGTGGVFCIHMNSDPARAVTAPATPIHRPVGNQLPRPPLPHKSASAASSIHESQDGSGAIGGEVKSVNSITFVEPPIPVSNMNKGHGGNVEDGYDAEGGWGRDEAVNLLRQFYVQENGRAPVPRKKEGRAARLAAMMESQGMTTQGTALEGLLQQEREASETELATATESGSTGTDADDGLGPNEEAATNGDNI